MISLDATRALARWCSSVSPTTIWGTTTSGSPGTPCSSACAVAAHSKMSHTTARVSMPFFLNLAASSKLPAVHEPHMPTPVMATCTSLAISSISDSGAGAVPTGLIHTLIWIGTLNWL